jgi:tRNA uridine 5-carboxymethylaminomethyl modification enzyme
LIAGLNAACRVGGSEPVVIERTEGYTGILISDLITKGADEPYRMFTSRAEFRLSLRIDNADERLTPIGRRLGLVTQDRWDLFVHSQRQKALLRERMDSVRMGPSLFESIGLATDDRPTLAVWIRRPEARITQIIGWIRTQLGEDPLSGVLQTLETELKYSGYIAQQQRLVDRLHDSERRHIPQGFRYIAIPGLSAEVREKLERVRPDTLGQAGRIPGVTPAAVAVLDVYLSLAR